MFQVCFFKCLNNIRPCVYVCGYHIFIISLSLDVNLGCFRILAMVNDTINEMEMAVQVSP